MTQPFTIDYFISFCSSILCTCTPPSCPHLPNITFLNLTPYASNCFQCNLVAHMLLVIIHAEYKFQNTEVILYGMPSID